MLFFIFPDQIPITPQFYTSLNLSVSKIHLTSSLKRGTFCSITLFQIVVIELSDISSLILLLSPETYYTIQHNTYVDFMRLFASTSVIVLFASVIVCDITLTSMPTIYFCGFSLESLISSQNSGSFHFKLKILQAFEFYLNSLPIIMEQISHNLTMAKRYENLFSLAIYPF